MLQVTEDLQSRLYELEQARKRLTKWRDETIRTAQSIIERTNREYDSEVLPLGREINELRERLQIDTMPEPEPTAPRRQRSHKAPVLDGLDDDEQAHYRRLLAAKKKRK